MFAGVMVVSTLVSLLVWRLYKKSMASAFEPGLEQLRQEAWTATVTRREVKDVPIAGPHVTTKVPLLVVYYRRDQDGVEGQVMQYKDDVMDSMYAATPGLEYYREAPSYQVLDSWVEGDRLEKHPGDYFPRKVF